MTNRPQSSPLRICARLTGNSEVSWGKQQQISQDPSAYYSAPHRHTRCPLIPLLVLFESAPALFSLFAKNLVAGPGIGEVPTRGTSNIRAESFRIFARFTERLPIRGRKQFYTQVPGPA